MLSYKIYVVSKLSSITNLCPSKQMQIFVTLNIIIEFLFNLHSPGCLNTSPTVFYCISMKNKLTLEIGGVDLPINTYYYKKTLKITSLFDGW